MVNGNRRLGYNLGIWNCRKGLIKGKKVSTKMVDVMNFIHSKKLHMLCLVESDLHGQASRYRRAEPLTTADINTQLAIPVFRFKHIIRCNERLYLLIKILLPAIDPTCNQLVRTNSFSQSALHWHYNIKQVFSLNRLQNLDSVLCLLSSPQGIG